MFLALLMCLAQYEPLTPPKQVSKERALVLVTCPKNTTLYVSDLEDKWKVIDNRVDETPRDFWTPPLDPQKRYGYVFIAKLPDGRVIKKQVIVKQGMRIEISFP
jgi:hypothetical protein